MTRARLEEEVKGNGEGKVPCVFPPLALPWLSSARCRRAPCPAASGNRGVVFSVEGLPPPNLSGTVAAASDRQREYKNTKRA